MKTLAMPGLGLVKVTAEIAEQLRSLSLIATLNGKLFPAAGKSAKLVDWMERHTERQDPDPSGRQVYIRFKPAKVAA